MAKSKNYINSMTEKEVRTAISGNETVAKVYLEKGMKSLYQKRMDKIEALKKALEKFN